MIQKNIFKKVNTRNEKFIFQFEYLENSYIQTIKIVANKIQYYYYLIKKEDIILVQDKNILSEFIKKYELLPNDIYYYQKVVKNSKKRNKEVKEYAKEFCTVKLLQNETFVKEYSGWFIREKIRILREIYTNEKSYTYGGYQSGSQITLCSKEKNDEQLRAEDIVNSKELQQVLLHEMIHFLLRRPLIKGTGMLIYAIRDLYEFIKKIELVELGRGFNEGLTEWITKKLGYDVENGAYVDLTHFVEQLELALGEENVMSLGKGFNLEKRLNLTKEELYVLLSKGDRYYQLIIEEIDLENILETCGYFRYLNNCETDEEKQDVIEDFGNLSESEEYIELKDGEEYKKYLIDHNLEDSLVSFIRFCDRKLEKTNQAKEELRAEIDEIIFFKYFIKEFDEISQMKDISKELLRKYSILHGLMHNEEIRLKLQKFKIRYIEIIENEMQLKYNNNSLGISDIINYMEGLSDLRFRYTFNQNEKYEYYSTSEAMARIVRKNNFW